MPRTRLAQRNADRLASIERELADFSYIVSHDIGAPIRHMAEFSRLLLAELGEEPTDNQQAHAAHIRAAADKCQSMIERLLTYSRVQHKTIEPIRHDATLTMRLALLPLAGEAQAAGVQIAIAPLGEVSADPDLLILAFRHLLENAVRFRRPDVPPQVRVLAAHDEETWRVRVCDNGGGVQPAYRDRVFGMFQRLPAHAEHPGVGAGLTICRRIARRHGGDVRFLDAAQGACVELALPRRVVSP